LKYKLRQQSSSHFRCRWWVGSARARAETIGIVGVSAKAGIATAGEIGGTRPGLIVRVFGRFEVRVMFFGKS
jgi:hypothetical protein